MIKFGTGGFRGIIGDDFNKENIQLIAQAISNVIIKNNLRRQTAIGYDYRFLSPEAATWMSEVFAGNEIKVNYSCEPTPSPTMIYATKMLGIDYGVMITASHNPPTFNGIKVFQKGGMDADIETTQKIEYELNSISKVKSVSSLSETYKNYVTEISFTEDYISYVKEFISPTIKGNTIKVLYDGFYGVGERTIKEAIKEYELSNITLKHCRHDALFGGSLPNPTKDNMLRNKQEVIENNYAFCFGMDSDGDRLGIIDEKGNYVDSNEIMACLYYYLIKYRNESGDCVRNLATSILMDKVSNKFGYKCHEVDVGFKNISSKMKDVNALLGGESSGGLTIRNYLFGKDSTFSSLLFLEMVIVMNKPVSEIVKEVKDFCEYSYIFDEDVSIYDKNLNIYDCLNTTTPKFNKEPIRIEKINNNVKYHFDNNEWILLRISGTEPALRVFIEMEDINDVYENKKLLNTYINNLNKETIK